MYCNTLVIHNMAIKEIDTKKNRYTFFLSCTIKRRGGNIVTTFHTNFFTSIISLSLGSSFSLLSMSGFFHHKIRKLSGLYVQETGNRAPDAMSYIQKKLV